MRAEGATGIRVDRVAIAFGPSPVPGTTDKKRGKPTDEEVLFWSSAGK